MSDKMAEYSVTVVILNKRKHVSFTRSFILALSESRIDRIGLKRCVEIAVKGSLIRGETLVAWRFHEVWKERKDE